MWTGGTDNRNITNTAEARLLLMAIDFTFAWTECAGIHQIQQLMDGFVGLIHSFVCHFQNADLISSNVTPSVALAIGSRSASEPCR